jgi:hypothetical protein
LLAALALLEGIAGAGPARADAPLGWSAPVEIDHHTPFEFNRALFGVSCPATNLCLTGDTNGDLFTATNPTGGAGAWTGANVDPEPALEGMSCPSTTFCVAVDNVGDVVTSTSPTGGTGAWNVADIDGSAFLYTVSCPTTTLCVAVDENGNVLTSTNPTGGAGA